MNLDLYLRDYFTQAEDLIFDTELLPLKTLFPSPNDGIIKPNRYYDNHMVHRYLYTSALTTIHALSSRFLGGVYFLWDHERKLMKIGCSSHLENRVFQLINDAKIYVLDDNLSLVGIHPTSSELVLKLEAKYHKLFEEYAYRNEWFKLSLAQYIDVIHKSSTGLSASVNPLFGNEFLLIYSMMDLLPDDFDTILDIWPYSQKQIRQFLQLDNLEKHKITLLIQDHKGDIIPFGWRQGDLEYLNQQNIWENKHLVCFQKLRILAVNDMHRQENFACEILGI